MSGSQAPSPEVLDILARDGGRVYATVYRPRPGESPAPVPVVGRAHPGPTSNAPLRLDPWVQFFLGHGFAVLDVDYRGSTGYGRAYRNALRGRWGVLDVSDCVDAVHAAGRVVGRDGTLDLTRVVISGASAGGYTALRAATNTTTFRAATVRSAIVDPAAWRTAAPKFQSRHADLLLGPVDTWGDRSLLRSGTTAHCPILAFHGERDTVTPLHQVREFVAMTRLRITGGFGWDRGPMRRQAWISIAEARGLSYLDLGGDGRVMLALHGSLGRGAIFLWPAADLRVQVRIVAPDQRGHGDSDCDGGFSRDEFVHDAAAFLRRLGLGPVVVLGHSLGGITAYQLAAHHPELVSALIIEDVGDDPDGFAHAVADFLNDGA
ncbi:MAG: alpha/beta fold hydrolase [Pseudonocardiales bacterium]|nr:alpha/beta fold hydrolase [Pseudonocardiales bacterium]MBV9031194.1 alpha/beta fold hydrolase [Pseudonocardiales bacterium]